MDNTDFKDRIRQAVEKYNKKILNENLPPTRKNNHPELETQNKIYKWCLSQGWSLDIVDASASWDKSTEEYSRVAVKSGYSDLSGVMPAGRAIYIEVKAPGKRSTLKEHQREFLIDKINHNAFACCSDSVNHLMDLLNRWKISQDKKQLLIDDLPHKKENQVKIFED